MRKITLSIVVVSAALGLAGCSTMDEARIAEAGGVTPKGSAFNTGLYKGYLHQARLEAKEYDFRDGGRWAGKAIAASKDGKVSPEELAAWTLPKNSVGDLTGARARLVAALAAGAGAKIPGEAARAQVMFDCWVQEQEENVQPADIRACRSGFESALAKVEGALKPVAAKAPGKEMFIVYFNTDSDAITAETRAVLSLVRSAAAKASGRRVVLAGHTDRAGDNGYNDVLSRKRVDSVGAALIAAGLTASTVSKSIHGEKKPRVATEDGVREKQNRRVEITVE
jgi:outer membrane protein OmpA-like peptidoglycan-associated protein